jgi:phosphohistidine phosphatase
LNHDVRQDKCRAAWQDHNIMHQLLLLRHAKSSWDEPKLADRDRPLNKRGRRAAVVIRDAMHGLGLAPDVVLVSPSRRTQETLAALEPWDDTPLVEPLETLYLASARQLLGVLRDVHETVRSVMLIGHNPGMHELGVMLLSARTSDQAQSLVDGFPTAALAEFAIGGTWAALDAGGGQLVRFLRPRDLPEMAD